MITLLLSQTWAQADSFSRIQWLAYIKYTYTANSACAAGGLGHKSALIDGRWCGVVACVNFKGIPSGPGVASARNISVVKLFFEQIINLKLDSCSRRYLEQAQAQAVVERSNSLGPVHLLKAVYRSSVNLVVVDAAVYL